MPKVGAVWFYKKGVANILSQYRIATLSKWIIKYSTKRFHQTRRVKNLSYDVVTTEGIKCRFKLMPERLHVYEVSPVTNKNIFGTITIDNLIDRDNNTYHIRINNNDNLIGVTEEITGTKLEK